jgi:hypothetical protein
LSKIDCVNISNTLQTSGNSASRLSTGNHPVAETAGEKLQLATQLLDRIQGQIRVVDEKIRALFSANTLLAAALTFTHQINLHSLPQPWGPLALAGSILMLLATVGSVVLALIALTPRLHSGNKAPGLFFFGDIAGLPAEQFSQEFQRLTEEEVLAQVLAQIHTNAQIALVKNRYMARSSRLLFLVLVLWFGLLAGNIIL